ncbi:hypothetical protein CYR23_21630 [Chimaeribacter arupi]|nr:hypothetical protein CYR23_21630 [Chimaeribacter arupi]
MKDETVESENIESYQLKILVKTAFNNADEIDFRCFLDAIVTCSKQLCAYRFELTSLVNFILESNALFLLNSLCPEKNTINTELFEAIVHIFHSKKLFTDKLSISNVLDWCLIDPEIRFNCIAQLFVPYVHQDGVFYWTELALEIINNCTDVDLVLGKMVEHFIPRRWSGSRATKMETKRPLLAALVPSARIDVSTAAAKYINIFDRKIVCMKESELKKFREEEERFE